MHACHHFLETYATNYAAGNANASLQLTINHNQTVKNTAISSLYGVEHGSKAGGGD